MWRWLGAETRELAQTPVGMTQERKRNHRVGEYVRGISRTNSMESFWSLLKRAIIGTYHNVSKKYLPLYLAELSFRFNNRNNPDIFGPAIAGS